MLWAANQGDIGTDGLKDADQAAPVKPYLRATPVAPQTDLVAIPVYLSRIMFPAMVRLAGRQNRWADGILAVA